ncbi:MAG: CBS domain protein [Tenericutes bacterium ADurb.BinA155]|nr:MAG: CBS domain protein [Tenericutes bacterium ADurb.BinA155]
MNNSDNVLFLLTPKKDVEYLYGDFSIRQALEKMEFHRYTMIPVIDKATGTYLYSLREGDILWYLKDHHVPWGATEREPIAQIGVSRKIQAVSISATLEDLAPLIIMQNYVPITDDHGVFIGIVTRKAVMNAYLKKD